MARIVPNPIVTKECSILSAKAMKVLDTVSTVLKQKGSAIWSIDPDATVYEALEILSNRSIGALLAMRNGALLGVLSERDYARRVILKGRSSKDTKVSEIMTSPVITVSPDCSVDSAMRLMTEKHLRHLPVKLADGSISGLVSLGDLVKWIITSHEKTIEQLENYIGGKSAPASDARLGGSLLARQRESRKAAPETLHKKRGEFARREAAALVVNCNY